MSGKREMSPRLNRTGWCFVISGVFLIILFVFLPMAQALITSFQTGVGNSLSFAGIANYRRILTDTTFRKALFNTVLYLIVQVPVMILLALVTASILNNKKLKLRAFFRTAVFLPCVTSLAAYSIVFKSLFAADGFVNAVLMKVNLIAEPISWLTDPMWAKILIILAITWRWTGYNTVFFLSGMQGIDDSVYEAADIDGAGAVGKFKSITLPMLRPIILFTTVSSTIGTLQLFDETMNITQGGPANATITISQYIYNILFKYSPDFGYASAVSFVIAVMIAGLSFLQMKAGDKDG